MPERQSRFWTRGDVRIEASCGRGHFFVQVGRKALEPSYERQKNLTSFCRKEAASIKKGVVALPVPY